MRPIKTLLRLPQRDRQTDYGGLNQDDRSAGGKTCFTNTTCCGLVMAFAGIKVIS